MIKKISTYHLLVELLNDGEGKIYPDLEPIEIGTILSELKARSGKDLGVSADKWVGWFVSTEDAGSKKERACIKTITKIVKIDKKYRKRIEE